MKGNNEPEYHPIFYRDIQKIFYAIWPNTSDTFNQRHRSEFPQYTIVVHIIPENSREILEKIEQIKKYSRHNFKPTSYLHFAFLGLNSIEQKPIDPSDYH